MEHPIFGGNKEICEKRGKHRLEIDGKTDCCIDCGYSMTLLAILGAYDICANLGTRGNQ